MSAREMWAPRGWRELPGMVAFSGKPEPVWSDDVRVLVEEIPEGRPSFKVGDRVGLYGISSRYTVFASPFPCGDEWRVPVSHDGRNYSASVTSAELTLVPTETSRLIRVTGPEAGVNETVQILHNRKDAAILTRVEVVE